MRRPHLALAAVAATPFSLLVPHVASADAPAPQRVIVGFDHDATASDRANAVDDVDGTAAESLGVPGLRVITLPRGETATAAAADLRGDDNVAFAQPDLPVHALSTTLNDPFLNNTWGLSAIGAPDAWDLSTGEGATVAVVDTGVDFTHPDLAGRQWGNPGELGKTAGSDDDHDGYVDDQHGWDFVDGDNKPADQNNHGTHVSGTIAADGDNGIGVAGVAYDARIMPLRVLNAAGSGSESAVVAAFSYAGAHGARVVNASLAGGGTSQAILAAVSHYPDTLYVVAAGNAGINNDVNAVWPCNVPAPNIICVAATTFDGSLAGFSDWGPTNVDLAAPGVNVLSTLRGGSYEYMSGTSMASPHVAGAAALLFSAKPLLSAAAAKAALLGSVDTNNALAGKLVSGGSLDVAAALQAIGAAPLPTLQADAPVVHDDGTATVAGTITANDSPTTWWLEWGTTTAYGHTTTPGDGGSAGSAQSVQGALSGLKPGSTYHVRLVARSAVGTRRGEDQSFTVPYPPPTVATTAADRVTRNDARMAGTINAHGQATTYVVEYGTTTGYGTRSSTRTLTTLSGTVTVTVTVTGSLAPGTTYHYRLVATDKGGTTTGADTSFTTAPAAAPTVVTQPATSVAATSAKTHGTVTPNGLATTAWFEYGTDTSYGKSTPAASLSGPAAATALSAKLALDPSTTYHYRLVAKNDVGTTYGTDATFTTPPPPKPTLSSVASSAVHATTAKIAATVAANGAATAVRFEWGPTAAYGHATSEVTLTATDTVPLLVPLGGLLPRTTYHWRVTAVSTSGTTVTSDHTFTTPSA